MSAFKLYLLLVLIPGVCDFFTSMFLISLIIFSVTVCARILTFGTFENEHGDDVIALINKVCKTSAIVFCFSCIGFLVPNKKDMALIVSGSYVTNIENIEVLPEKTVRLLSKYLDEALQDSVDKTKG